MAAPLDRTPPPWQRANDVALIALVAIVLCVPSLGMVFPSLRGGGEHEKRALAGWPTTPTTLMEWTQLPAGLQAYARDHFALRGLLIRAHARLLYEGLGTSPSTAVWRGRNGWLYYADDGAREDLLNDPLPEAFASAWATTFEDGARWLADRGIAYIVVVAPDKHVTYPGFLPKGVSPRTGLSAIDQVLQRLAESNVRLVDLRGPLRHAAREARVYHVTDTHWNALGAHVGYEAIMQAVRAQVPSVGNPLPLTAFDVARTRSPGLDLAQMLDLEDRLTEESFDLVPRTRRRAVVRAPLGASPTDEIGDLVLETPDPSLPRALVFRDSFASALVPLMAEHFSRVRFLWQRELDPEVVVKERPAVVIHEVVGRRFRTHLPFNYFADR